MRMEAPCAESSNMWWGTRRQDAFRLADRPAIAAHDAFRGKLCEDFSVTHRIAISKRLRHRVLRLKAAKTTDEHILEGLGEWLTAPTSPFPCVKVTYWPRRFVDCGGEEADWRGWSCWNSAPDPWRSLEGSSQQEMVQGGTAFSCATGSAP